jgi:hypothetical protein
MNQFAAAATVTTRTAATAALTALLDFEHHYQAI